MVDLPFALPTAVSGIVLTSLYSSTDGWFGRWLAPLGIDVAYTRLGVVVALTFIGLPFVVRTLQPALEDLDPEIEEAAASLGAGRLAAFWRVILPSVLPALLSGFALAFARGLGEYGSVVFIAGNKLHADRDRTVSHRQQARPTRLRRSHGHRRRHVGGFVRPAVDDQPVAMVESSLCVSRRAGQARPQNGKPLADSHGLHSHSTSDHDHLQAPAIRAR